MSILCNITKCSIRTVAASVFLATRSMPSVRPMDELGLSSRTFIVMRMLKIDGIGCMYCTEYHGDTNTWL